jgi:deoxyribose-phosphate aldolase
MIRLTTLENRFETDLITDALAQEGIDHVVKPFHDTAYDGLFETQKGYGLLLVEEEQENRAREIVDAVRESVESE